MRKWLAFFVSLSSFISFSQHQKGFSENEAIDMVRICNSFSSYKQHGNDSLFIPSNYRKIYTSPSYGMDNIFQVYTDEHSKKAVIHFRGTSSQKISWMENFYSTMIPANDQLSVNGKTFKYNLSTADNAYIHTGYTLALSYLEEPVLEQIKRLNQIEIYTFYLTGHSQGGAIAQLFAAYLSLLTDKNLIQNEYKTYAFANTMVGNDAFATDYNKRFCETGMSYLIHNPADLIIKLPLSESDTTFVLSTLERYSTIPEYSTQAALLFGVYSMMKDRANELINSVLSNVELKIEEELGPIILPANTDTKSIYVHTANVVLIEPSDYSGLEITVTDNKIPKEVQDSPFFNLVKGILSDVNLQHKTYNYYTGVLKLYRPQEYNSLKEKVFLPN